eukprot:scaffold888_cov569-Prasinococcus_capsulatus_cf.AAC.31
MAKRNDRNELQIKYRSSIGDTWALPAFWLPPCFAGADAATRVAAAADEEEAATATDATLLEVERRMLKCSSISACVCACDIAPAPLPTSKRGARTASNATALSACLRAPAFSDVSALPT